MGTIRKPWRRNYSRVLAAVDKPGSLQTVSLRVSCVRCAVLERVVKRRLRQQEKRLLNALTYVNVMRRFDKASLPVHLPTVSAVIVRMRNILRAAYRDDKKRRRQ